MIALGPHRKEKLFSWIWVIFHFSVCTVYVLFFLKSFFVSVFFFVSPLPSPKYSVTYSSKFGVGFQKSSIFTWSQKSNTLHKLPKISGPRFQFWHLGHLNQSFRVPKRLHFRFLVHYETSQGSHCSEVTCWKSEFAASFWLSWSSLSCIALLCFTESWFLSASHNKIWPNKNTQYGSIQCLKMI